MASELSQVTKNKLRERGWQALKPVYAAKIQALGCPKEQLEEALDEIRKACWDMLGGVGKRVSKEDSHEKVQEFAADHGFFTALDEQLDVVTGRGCADKE